MSALREHPGIRYVALVENADADPVILAMAIRGVGTFEVAIPREHYDPFALIKLLHQE